MAFIDKTYVNHSQWIEGKKFIENTAEQQKKAFGSVINLYYNSEEEVKGFEGEFVLWNTSFIKNVWLYQNCKLPFVQSRLTEQYGEKKPALFDLIDFSIDCVLLVGVNDEKNVYFNLWKEVDSDGTVDIYDDEDEILLYGTSLMLSVLEDCKKIMHDSRHHITFNGKIFFNFYGCDILYDPNNENTYYTLKDGEEIPIEIPYYSEDVIKLPKVNYSFKREDFSKYDPNKIYFCNEKEVFQLTHYKEWQRFAGDARNLCRFSIPNYIQKIIL